MSESATEFTAWNPGLSSEIPKQLLPQATLYLPENSEVDYAEASEAAAFCGLDAKEMVAFRFERLITHELLIRVTADLSVPDGPNYEELGINLRAMTARICKLYIEPKLDSLRAEFDALRQSGRARMLEILDRDIYQPKSPTPAPKTKGFLAGLFKSSKPKVSAPAMQELPEIAALADWQKALSTEDDPFQNACLSALVTIVGGVVGARGRLVADRETVARLALNIFSNTHGSRTLGAMLDPIIREAVETENYRFLPVQEKPFFMNVKGASAAGKSTIRPAQRRLAERLEIPWEDFALISPDYWRKFLLDYDSLGDDYKYAAMLTGQELEIIDKKLDRYMERKAAAHAIPHLLIDRFRFDSFKVDKGENRNSQLLTRFGDTVYFFFVITPPAATVERAWKRGNSTGRFKAVDDLLYHNVEAYTGMPNLFFSSVVSPTKKVHFEFLDNSVRKATPPRTIAFGWNTRMTILDLERLNDVDRFKEVNLDAKRPEDVLTGEPGTHFGFVKTCLKSIPEVVFADYDSAEIYGRVENGKWVYRDSSVVQGRDDQSVLMKCLRALGWFDAPDTHEGAPRMLDVDAESRTTLGDWPGSEVRSEVSGRED